MNSATEKLFSTRPTVVVELPLAPKARILRPEQVIVKIEKKYKDLGAFCYTLRSNKKRKPGQPRDVVLSSFRPQRLKRILQVIKVLSAMLADDCKRPWTVKGLANYFKLFLDWADAAGYHECLAGDGATRSAYRAWAAHVEERYRRHELKSQTGSRLQTNVCGLLETITGIENLSRGVRTIRKSASPNDGTEPATEHNFAHILALNQAIFDGLCDLVLDNQPFPFMLNMPPAIGWKDCHLWIFPANRWHLPPHLWGKAREKLDVPHWAYNYENGCLASVDEIWQRYRGKTPAKQRGDAKKAIGLAQQRLDLANADPRHHERIMLGMIAHNAFVFLFFANTGVNNGVAQHIETDGKIDASTLNQSYRAIKYRAQGKEVPVIIPAAFMPTLRRFMELRKYLMNEGSYPYLLFTLVSKTERKPPAQFHENILAVQYRILHRIEPNLPRITVRKIRATVEDYYRRNADAAIAARVMGHSEAVADRNYLAGSPVDHRDEMTLFLHRVSETARAQRVVADSADLGDAKPLEEGGRCSSFGHPEAMAEDMPKPDCRQGCLFCAKRILVANEEDARKVASAAFVMEQLILGPLSEAEFRSQIQKCDDDLEKIATFDDCRDMVKRVRQEVYVNGNLTPYFADKYQLFLELGVL